MDSNAPTDRCTTPSSKIIRSRFSLLFVAALASLLVFACGGNGNGGGSDDELDEDLFSAQDGDAAEDHWITINATTGPFVSIAIFEDGTGQISFGNDSFNPNAGDDPNTRTIYSFQWESNSDDALEAELDEVDWQFELNDIDVDGNTFEATYSDDDGDEDFDFTRQNGAIST